MLPQWKRAKIRQLLKDLGSLVNEYNSEQIQEHKEIFLAILTLIEKLEWIKQNEEDWSGDYTIPHTIYLGGYIDKE